MGRGRVSGCLAAGVACALTWVAFAGCSWTSDFDVEQCSADADCNAVDTPVAYCEGTRCVPGCRNNQQCATADPRYPICPEVGAECVELTSEGSACELSSGYVDSTMGQRTAQDLLLIGSFAPKPESATWLSLLLAANEINARGGLPDSSGDLLPLVLVTCDDHPDRMGSAMPHLLTDLRVRAVLANVEERALAAAMDQASRRAPAVFVNPRGNDYRPDAESAGWLWSLGAPATRVTAAYPALLQRLVRRATAVAAGDGFWRLVFLVGGTREDRALADAVMESLTIDGKPAAQLVVEDHLRVVDLDEDSAERRIQQLEQLVAAYPPDVVASFASGNFPDIDRLPRAGAAALLESLAAASARHPYYLMSPRDSNAPAWVELMLVDPSIRQRILGVSADPPADPVIQARLEAAYASAYPDAAESLVLQGSTYDAVYYLAYALVAGRVNGSAATAQDALVALSRITTPGAEPVQVGAGSEGLDKAWPLLRGGLPMDLSGSAGPARFDAENGRAGAVRIYCLDDHGQQQTIARYDAAAADDGIVLDVDAAAAAVCARLLSRTDAD